MTPGIYQIRNIINGKKYIGSSSNIERRFKQHRNGLEKNKHYNKFLQLAFNEYGIKCFKFEITEKCTVELLKIRELFYLDKYENTWDKLYNETKNTNDSMRGLVLTEDHKHNISVAKTGIKRSDKTKKLISKNHADMLGENNPFYNKHHTPEAKHNMSISRTGTKFINKNGINKRVKPEQLEQYLSAGWIIGIITKGKYKKCTK